MAQQDKSLGELFSDLARDMSTLVRQEVQLAKAEITSSISSLVKTLIFVVIGAAFAVLSLQAFLGAAIFGLAQVVEPWLAALIVGAVLLLIGAIFVMMGIKTLKGAELAPKQTVETIKEDVQWAKEQTK